MRLPKKLKAWLAVFSASALILAVVAYFNEPYAKGILLSFFRGEIAIIYWMGHVGLSQKEALVITILISTVSISNYFWLGGQASKPVSAFLRKHASYIKKVLGISAKKNWREQNVDETESKFRKLAGKFPYFVLPLYNFDPFFGVLTGIVVAKSSKLNMTAAFLIMCAGNAVEKTVWSYIIKSAESTIENAIIPIIYLSIGVAITYSFLRFLYDSDDCQPA